MEVKQKAALVIGAVGAGLAALLFRKKAEAHPGNIVLSGLIISPAEVYVGERVDIIVTATNIGDEPATKEIICEVD